MASEVYRMRVGGVNGAGNYAENDLHWLVGNVSGSDAWEEAGFLAVYWQATVLPLLKPLLGTDCIINVVEVVKINPPGGTSFNLILSETGTGPGQSISEGIAACVQLIAAGIPRPAHFFQWGMYVGSLAKDLIDVGTYIPALLAYVTQMTTPTALSNGDSAAIAIHNKLLGQWQIVEHFSVVQKVALFNKRLSPFV